MKGGRKYPSTAASLLIILYCAYFKQACNQQNFLETSEDDFKTNLKFYLRSYMKIRSTI